MESVMKIPLKCPHCEHKFKIKAKVSSPETKCPKCKELFSIRDLKGIKEHNKSIDEMESEKSFMMGSFR